MSRGRHFFVSLVIAACCTLYFWAPVLAQEAMSEALAAELGQYPNSTVVQATAMGDNHVLFIDCGGAQRDEVMAFYKGRAKGSGWETVVESRQEANLLFVASKDGRQLTVDVGAQGDTTMVGLTVSAQ